MIQRGIYDDVQREAFKPLHITKDKFLGLALKGRYQAPSLIIAMSEEMQLQIRKQLITLGHKLSLAQVDKFLKGEIALNPSIPNLKGRSGWDSKLRGLPELEEHKQIVQCKQQELRNSKQALPSA